MFKWCDKSSGRGPGVRGQRSGTETTFIWLLIASVAGISLLAFLLWWVPTIGLGNINRALPYLLAVLLIGIILFLFSSASLLALSASGRNVPFPDKLRGILVKLFFPAMLFLGGIFKVEKTKIHKEFIELSTS